MSDHVDPAVGKGHVLSEAERISAGMLERLRAAGLTGTKAIVALAAATKMNNALNEVAALLGGAPLCPRERRVEIRRLLVSLVEEVYQTGQDMYDAVGRDSIKAAHRDVFGPKGGAR